MMQAILRGRAASTAALMIALGFAFPLTAAEPRQPIDVLRSSPDFAALNVARAAKGRIVAVGTTVLRTLESAANSEGIITPYADRTDIFITPGYRFRGVDMLLTNFHLPRSTLFMLVSAFSGLERMKAAYAHAIAHEYRFYSYGDACLLHCANR